MVHVSAPHLFGALASLPGALGAHAGAMSSRATAIPTGCEVGAQATPLSWDCSTDGRLRSLSEPSRNAGQRLSAEAGWRDGATDPARSPLRLVIMLAPCELEVDSFSCSSWVVPPVRSRAPVRVPG